MRAGDASRREDEVAERPRDERVRRRRRDRAEHVRVRAEHDLGAGVQARGGEQLLARVRLRVELGAPVEEAHDDVGAAERGAHVGGDRARCPPARCPGDVRPR